MEAEPPDAPDPTKGLRTATRNIGIAIALFFLAYAIYGVFADDILVPTGKRGTGPQFATGEQAVLGAAGYLCFAVAALIVGLGGLIRPSKRGTGFETGSNVIVAVVFVVIGIILVGFRTPG
jgi:hypothetical protein